MSAWEPQIVRIESVEKHPNADNLDIVKVMGDHPVIVRKDSYKVGDLSSYIPIDTECADNQEFYFLCPQKIENYEEDGEMKQRTLGPKYEVGSVPLKYRIIFAKKIRGIYSMGMLHPPVPGLKEGDSIVNALNLKKWEEPEDDEMIERDGITSSYKGGIQAPSPKGFTIPYYDISNLRKYHTSFEEDEEVVIMEKIHGENFLALFDGENYYVRSRRLYKKIAEDNIQDRFVAMFYKYDLFNKLKQYPRKAIFGELYGLNNGFRYDATINKDKSVTPRVRFFDVLNIDTMRFLDYDDASQIIDDMELDKVPLLFRGPWKSLDDVKPLAEQNSVLGNHISEGFVISPVKERYDTHAQGRCKHKLVSENYALQKHKKLK